MTHTERVDLFEDNIKSELSRIIPKTGEGLFFRELIFGHTEVQSWFNVAMLIQKHFPQKTKEIELFCSKLSA